MVVEGENSESKMNAAISHPRFARFISKTCDAFGALLLCAGLLWAPSLSGRRIERAPVEPTKPGDPAAPRVGRDEGADFSW